MADRPGFFRRILRTLCGDACAPPPGEEELRTLFAARSQAFMRLLSANNKALEIMSDLEEALGGSRIFGMSFIRANTTAVGVNVFKLVRSLTELEPGRYEPLFDRLASIQAEIDAILSRKAGRQAAPLVLDVSRIDRHAADLVGGKMANLADMRTSLGLPVPAGFVVTAAGYEAFMAAGDLQAEINARLQSLPEDAAPGDAEAVAARFRVSSEIRQSIMAAQVPPPLADAIRGAYACLREELGGATVRVSLRSSALGEDAAGTTFAGQFKSILNVPEEGLLDAYKEIVASKHTLHAITYRLNRGIRDEDVAMCVGCMELVDARAGGVMYSRNPLAPRDPAVVINSVWGLPTAVVDGTTPTDLFVVERVSGDGFALREREIKTKAERTVPDQGEGLRREVLPAELAAEPSLTDAQALELARFADGLERAYGGPQDIEWAVDPAGRVQLLQCRPLALAAPDATGIPTGRAVPGATELLAGGAAACAGAGAGPVFVARKEIDALRFPDGAVLVVPMALPRWAALLPRAAALVAEQGGITGHLANVAREFGVPALFDVPGAADALSEGVEVTVDALGRRIYAGRVDALLSKQAPRATVMAGSPVFECLREVSRLVLPLNLTDPESPEFRPENCSTYHDITRYAHEMSVRDMFDFGARSGLASQASKQLACEVPMQWWVVNLDDGFTGPVPERFVHLADISSAPMLAIWAGICAVPWAGPPPASARGMMNVFLEATMNPELAEGGPGGFSDRNVFMISSRYACLSSRFGFHFTTIESMLTDGDFDSYAGFKFSGGAADAGRRVLRAELIADVLERHGFHAKVRGDNLFAKAESRDHGFILDRLRILGYLLVHTRQLDMAMADRGAADAMRDKLLSDITAILAVPFPLPQACQGWAKAGGKA
ncbi:pyruvate, water dikinase [Humidesulfovibrio mexicanus]|uniref:Phosphoenolpyruvate synthase n=2 Tax=Humidesulfovibrio mexicanus TaxID=147047 RepID=A0A238ZB42_9BACT|nr:pyruvate, water dikinase [Humidesulfovibrio mexicanus]